MGDSQRPEVDMTHVTFAHILLAGMQSHDPTYLQKRLVDVLLLCVHRKEHTYLVSATPGEVK